MSANYLGNIRQEVVPFLPDNYSRVLEIGCSDGAFCHNSRSDAETWGVEANANSAEMAKRIFKHVYVGEFDSIKKELPKDYFNLLICNDVIEHVVDHDLFLRDLKQLLAPGGVLVGSVPNMRSAGTLAKLLLYRDWLYEIQGVVDRTHLRWFTQKSLLRSLENAGFEVEEFRGINSEFVRRRSLFRCLIIGLIILFTIGWYSDIQFAQFAFRAKNCLAPISLGAKMIDTKAT